MVNINAISFKNRRSVILLTPEDLNFKPMFLIL